MASCTYYSYSLQSGVRPIFVVGPVVLTIPTVSSLREGLPLEWGQLYLLFLQSPVWCKTYLWSVASCTYYSYSLQSEVGPIFGVGPVVLTIPTVSSLR